MPVNVEFSNFDKGLYLLGGRSEMPDGTMRVATGTHPIHTGSVRSRAQDNSILDTQMISTYRFYTNRVGVDTAGNVWWLPDAVAGLPAGWIANHAYTTGTFTRTNTSNKFQLVTTPGTSGSTVPVWNNTLGGTTTDGGVTWTNNGVTMWQKNHVYALNTIIIDSNGNFQKVTTNGTSNNVTEPTWATTINSTTTDGTVTWTMIGGIIKTGLTAGARVNFTKAPPQIGDTAYLFVSGGGKVFKIDNLGNVTNWGIAAPADGMTAALGTLNTTTIDTMTLSAGWSVSSNGTKADDSSMFIVSPSSIKVVCNASGLITLSKSITINLTAFTSVVANSFLQDVIRLYVAIDQPYLIDHIGILFSLGDTTYTNALWKRVNIKVARNTKPNALGMQDVLQIDNAVAGQTNLSNVYYNATTNKIAVAPGERIRHHDILYNAEGGIVHSGIFNLWQLPKESFVRIGTDTTIGWHDVKAVKFNIACKSASVKPTVWFNDLFMSGGSGLIGTYQYLAAFGNSTTGTLSNGNPTPVVMENINRHTVNLASIPVSTDPQVNERVILRTVGNGGYFYQDHTIADNSTTTYTDSTSDFFGLNGGTDPVGPDSASNASEATLTGPIFAFVNAPPASTYARSTIWQGTMFWCGDTATGAKGRVYYSAIGNSEGVASFTDVSNDDDPTQALMVWNNQLYLWTTKAVYAIYQANDPNVVVNPSYPIPLFVGQLITGAPGTIAPFSLASTPQGVMYQSNEQELMYMNGYQSIPVAPQILQLLRGESVEGYSAIGTIIAAAYGRLEYMFSDGTSSFAYNTVDGAVRALGIPLTALYFEPDTGQFVGSNASEFWMLYETAVSAGLSAVPFTLMTPSGYINGEKYTGQVRYIFIDANLNGQTLTPTLILDNTTVAFSTITNSARGIIELTTNQTGRIVGLQLTGNLTSQIEIFRIAFDDEPAGSGDDSTSSFQKQLKAFVGA